MDHKYIFTSKRLGFRTWSIDDLPELEALCADPEVMKHFPNPLTRQETKGFISRLIDHHAENGYCYFACETLNTGKFIGFIGLALQTYESPFAPATDLGWRLKKGAWGKGYATEGAIRCMEYAFEELNLEKVVAVCTRNNSKSENIMQKIGMIKQGSFDHPKLAAYPDHQTCIWYQKENL